MRSNNTFRVGATFGAVALLTAGCLSDGGGGGGGGSENTSRSIEVMYAFASGSKQESGFRAEVDAWAQENDVEIEYAAGHHARPGRRRSAGRPFRRGGLR